MEPTAKEMLENVLYCLPSPLSPPKYRAICRKRVGMAENRTQWNREEAKTAKDGWVVGVYGWWTIIEAPSRPAITCAQRNLFVALLKTRRKTS